VTGSCLDSFLNNFKTIFIKRYIYFMEPVNDLMLLYKKLSLTDKYKFDMLYLNYKKNDKILLGKNKENLMKQLSDIKDIYGNSYFDDEYLKKLLNIDV
jgi:hypothetical protein